MRWPLQKLIFKYFGKSELCSPREIIRGMDCKLVRSWQCASESMSAMRHQSRKERSAEKGAASRKRAKGRKAMRKEGTSKIGAKGRKEEARSVLRVELEGAGVVNTRWEGTWRVVPVPGKEQERI
jgi:hypothetical protein